MLKLRHSFLTTHLRTAKMVGNNVISILTWNLVLLCGYGHTLWHLSLSFFTLYILLYAWFFWIALSLFLCMCNSNKSHFNRHFLGFCFDFNIQFLVASSFQVRHQLYYVHIYEPLSSSLDTHFNFSLVLLILLLLLLLMLLFTLFFCNTLFFHPVKYYLSEIFTHERNGRSLAFGVQWRCVFQVTRTRTTTTLRVSKPSIILTLQFMMWYNFISQFQLQLFYPVHYNWLVLRFVELYP